MQHLQSLTEKVFNTIILNLESLNLSTQYKGICNLEYPKKTKWFNIPLLLSYLLYNFSN